MRPKEPDDNQFSFQHEEDRLKKEFKDFLEAPEIAGRSKGFPTSNRIPSEQISETGYTIEVAKETQENPDGAPASEDTVLIHRNKNDEIEMLEISCACGRQITIRFQQQDILDNGDDESQTIAENPEEPENPADDAEEEVEPG